MFKAIRRVATALAVSLMAFKAVGSFLSWIERQDEDVAESWIDEDELEEV